MARCRPNKSLFQRHLMVPATERSRCLNDEGLLARATVRRARSATASCRKRTNRHPQANIGRSDQPTERASRLALLARRNIHDSCLCLRARASADEGGPRLIAPSEG